MASFRDMYLNLALVMIASWMSFFIKGEWLPLMQLCFLGAFLSKVCKTKFSNASYDIFDPIEIGYGTFFEFVSITEFLDLRRKSWTVNSGRWTLDAGLWMLDSGLQALGSGRWTLETGLLMLDSGRWNLDARFWTLDPGSWTLDARIWMLDATLWKLGSGN